MGHLKNKENQSRLPLSVCLDANVIISAIGFGGIPLRILEMALSRRFHLVLGPNIIDEARKNLVSKLGVEKKEVNAVLHDLVSVASMFVPTGIDQYIEHEKDNLVIELVVKAECDVLVTGDKKHLLPLKQVKRTVIESPSNFLKRLL